MQKVTIDQRINPYRNDIAAEKLRGHVDSELFVSGQHCSVGVSICPLSKNPEKNSEQISQLRMGDGFTVYDKKNGWVWGQACRDDYVGYAPEIFFEKSQLATHRIQNLSSFVFAAPSVKAPVLNCLPFLGWVAVKAQVTGDKAGGGGSRFCELEGGGFMHHAHLTAIDAWPKIDPVATAMRMVDVPYMWGGSTPMGLDCSGLVQLCWEAAGYDKIPRDADLQEKALGQDIARDIYTAKLQRGDLVFMAGHVAMMVDAVQAIHANAFHGRVVIEPLADIARRYDGRYCVKRL